MTSQDPTITPPQPRPGAADVTVYTLPLGDSATIGGWVSARASDPDKRVITWVLTQSPDNGGTLHPEALMLAEPSYQLGLTGAADFEAFAPEPFSLTGFDAKEAGEGRVFVGKLFGKTSPVETSSPAVGAELWIHPGAEFVFVVDESFTHGLLPLTRGLFLENEQLEPSTIGIVQPGAKTLHIVNGSSTMARALLLGGK